MYPDIAKTTPAKRNRGSIACKRCRRLRIKCRNVVSTSQLRDPRAKTFRDGNKIPSCEACKMAGPYEIESCTYPRRGEADVDRTWRSRTKPTIYEEEATPANHPATERTSQDLDASMISGHSMSHPDNSQRPVQSPAHQSSARAESSNDLPSPTEIVEACRVFTTSYFQLGFIPKTSFFERILKDEVSDFLLLCILCLSARFTPCLVKRYEDGTKATERFMAAALDRVPFEMYNANLENIQGLFLLSVAEWGNGDRDRSSIHMGIAVRMAAMMKLHREETYHLPVDATTDQKIYAETARRTFWMIQSQDNLHSGFSSPLPFSCEDITALLPSGESDYSFGIVPAERAALPSTPPALANPALVDSPRRSLFATLVQSHSLWGEVARRACKQENVCHRPSDEYLSMAETLRKFEERLPVQHKWSTWSLKVWNDLGFELAYLSIVMMIRLSNILLRRTYLRNIKISIGDQDGCPSGLWKPVSDELFENVVELYQQIEASFAMRSGVEGYPAILVFPIYVCGSLALNLWQCPQLCSRLAEKAVAMLTRCLQIIDDLQYAWPMARRWQEGLAQAATPLSAGQSPVSSRGVPPSSSVSTDQRPVQHTSPMLNTRHVEQPNPSNPPLHTTDESSRSTARLPDIRPNSLPFDIDALPTDLFDAEVAAFLQGDLHYGLLDEWSQGGFSFH